MINNSLNNFQSIRYQYFIISSFICFSKVPTSVPPLFTCKQESESKISLTWEHLDPDQWNGYMNGYKLEYVKYNENIPYSVDTFTSDKRNGMILNLEPFTKYEIYLRAMTRVGYGPRAWCVQSTQEGSKRNCI